MEEENNITTKLMANNLEKEFKRGDRVYDERYGNGIIDYLENHIIVQFRMGQYITYDLKGYRHFPEEKKPALFKR
jgi:hypothetical protein